MLLYILLTINLGCSFTVTQARGHIPFLFIPIFILLKSSSHCLLPSRSYPILYFANGILGFPIVKSSLFFLVNPARRGTRTWPLNWNRVLSYLRSTYTILSPIPCAAVLLSLLRQDLVLRRRIRSFLVPGCGFSPSSRCEDMWSMQFFSSTSIFSFLLVVVGTCSVAKEWRACSSPSSSRFMVGLVKENFFPLQQRF